MELREQIVSLMNQYLSEHEKNPTKLYLTRKQENELITFEETDITKDVRESFKNGFAGMEIIWDSNEFKVE